MLGVSCYFDVQDMMEKRVRSRFSNRKIFLPGLNGVQQVGAAGFTGFYVTGFVCVCVYCVWCSPWQK